MLRQEVHCELLVPLHVAHVASHSTHVPDTSGVCDGGQLSEQRPSCSICPYGQVMHVLLDRWQVSQSRGHEPLIAGALHSQSPPPQVTGVFHPGSHTHVPR